MRLRELEKETGPGDVRSLRMAIAGAQVKQCELARVLGCSEQQFSMFITGKRKPPEGFVKRAATALERLNEADRIRNRMLEEAATELRPDR